MTNKAGIITIFHYGIPSPSGRVFSKKTAHSMVEHYLTEDSVPVYLLNDGDPVRIGDAGSLTVHEDEKTVSALVTVHEGRESILEQKMGWTMALEITLDEDRPDDKVLVEDHEVKNFAGIYAWKIEE